MFGLNLPEGTAKRKNELLLTHVDLPSCVDEVRRRADGDAGRAHRADAVGTDHAAGAVGKM